jgi:LysR family transcriptional regulator, hydrogen peroxide-inducible genes activator
MNIQQIEYVIAVSDLRSFGKAAEKCFVTQSTLSTMVARFEDEIGLKLFDRGTKPITTTAEGDKAIYQLRTIIRELDHFEELLSQLKGEMRGVLRIGIIPTVGPYLLPLFLNRFIKKNPHIHFVLSEITTDKILTDLKNRELDIGILATPLNHAGLVEAPLYKEPFFLFDGANKTRESPIDINEIDEARLLLLNDGHCLRTQVEAICGLRQKRTHKRNLEYESGTIDTLMRFVRKNRAITLIPYLATLDFDEESNACLRQFVEPVPIREISLVVHHHFAKKGIFKLLKQEIIDVVNPLLDHSCTKEWLVNPT